MHRKFNINDWKRLSMKQKFIIIPWIFLLVVAVFIVSVIFVAVASFDSTQAMPAESYDVIFEGEYCVNDGEFHPIVSGEHIPTIEGEVTLRGTFRLCDPDTGEVVSGVEKGTSIAFHLSHIAATVYAYTFDCESPVYGEDTCGEMILPYIYRSGENDVVSIVVTTPHRFGNDNAVDHLCESFAVYDGVSYESEQISQGILQRIMGLIAIVTAFLILGVAVFSSLIHVDDGRKMCFVGLMMLFAGGYFLLSVPAVGLWSELIVFNTVSLGLCMMFYIIFLLIFAAFLLPPKHKWVGNVSVVIMTLATAVAVLVSFSERVLFYDTYLYWFLLAFIVCLATFVTLSCDLRLLRPVDLGLGFLTVLALLAVNVDTAATYLGFWRGGLVSRFIFVAIYGASLFTILRILPTNVNAALRAGELEKERRMLSAKLQESRISIMLSQIQPHFLYNVLNSIYYLCEKDPAAAQSAINHFSDYLRNNLNNLKETELITFDAELEHVHTYLELEKVRFGDELTVVYDTPVRDFLIPVLTVQPLVENAVKHGTSRKRGGGTVTVATRDCEDYYEITVTDTGKGFDPSAPPAADGHEHIGITNVRSRLKIRCDGKLTIQSTPGEGTVATIQIPKRRETT